MIVVLGVGVAGRGGAGGGGGGGELMRPSPAQTWRETVTDGRLRPFFLDPPPPFLRPVSEMSVGGGGRRRRNAKITHAGEAKRAGVGTLTLTN